MGWTFRLASGHAPNEKPLAKPLRCVKCGGTMRVMEVTSEVMVDLSDRTLACFDSG
ncbi:MAG: hypothetical protein AAF989_04005 [Planctomycetota bacterium]